MTTKPYTFSDGPSEKPSAAKWNDVHDWLTSIGFGNPIMNAGFESWNGGTSFTNPPNGQSTVDRWTYRKSGTSLSTTDITRESTTIDTETYSAKLNITGAGHADSINAFDQAIASYGKYKGLNVVCGFRVRVSTASKVRVKIYDGVTAAQYSSYHDGDGTWQTLRAALTVSASATQLTLSVEITSDFTGSIFIDGAFLYAVPSTISENAKTYLKYFPQIEPAMPLEGGAPAGITSINGSFLGGLRNRIINGDMRIDQRRAGASATITTGRTLFLDRWCATAAEGTISIVQDSPGPAGQAFSNTMKITLNTQDTSILATSEIYVAQFIEESMTRDFGWGAAGAKTVTLSFWVIADVAGLYGGGITNPSRSYAFTYTASTSWKKISIVIPGDTSGTWPTGKASGIRVKFDLGSGTNSETTTPFTWINNDRIRTSGCIRFVSQANTSRLIITGVQLEIGSVATEFEHRPDGLELMLCQRYYEKTFDLATAAAQNSGTSLGTLFYRVNVAGTSGPNGAMWRFNTPKRVAPTITLYNPGAANSNWRNNTDAADSGASTAASIGEKGAFITNAQAAGDAVGENMCIHAAADAEF